MGKYPPRVITSDGEIIAGQYRRENLPAAKSGLIKSPVNYRLKADEVAYQLNQCGARAVVTDPEYVALLQSVREKMPDLEHIIVIGNEKIEGTINYEELIANSDPGEVPVEILPTDIHMILYTSGTTGQPKGTIRGYMEGYHTGMTVCVEWWVRSGDIQMAVAPLYHAGSCAWFCATLASGGALVVVPAFIPEKLLQAIEKYRPNWMMMVPTMYDLLLSLPREILHRYDLSSLRTLISGGSPLHTPPNIKS